MKKVGFSKRTLADVPLDGRTVLLRADYNVPLLANGTIADDYRMTQSVPTIRALLDRGCKVIICSHLGRPDGKVVASESLAPVAEHLTELLGTHVAFVPDCIGDRVKQATKHLAKGKVLLLENLRFHAGEEANDPNFAELLAKDTGAEYFVQDGFGVVHRAHASTDAITRYLPSVAGLLLVKEYEAITGAMANPTHPMVAVLGGAKISDKIKVIERFVQIADKIIIGGAMANTFLKYHGREIGKSVHEAGLDDILKRIYDAAEAKVGAKNLDEFIILPTDVAVAAAINEKARRAVVRVDDIDRDDYILDIGFESIDTATEALQGAGTVVWNGTMGYAELPQFAHGSARIALALASQPETVSVIGGGDTADFVLHWDSQKGGSFSHVSTGGGASLELMAGEPMPGIEALLDA